MLAGPIGWYKSDQTDMCHCSPFLRIREIGECTPAALPMTFEKNNWNLICCWKFDYEGLPSQPPQLELDHLHECLLSWREYASHDDLVCWHISLSWEASDIFVIIFFHVPRAKLSLLWQLSVAWPPWYVIVQYLKTNASLNVNKYIQCPSLIWVHLKACQS